MASPMVSTACSLAAISYITILTKEGTSNSLQRGCRAYAAHIGWGQAIFKKDISRGPRYCRLRLCCLWLLRRLLRLR